MYSFRDIHGTKVVFEDIKGLELDTATDIVTEEVSNWFIYVRDQDCNYEVEQNTYETIEKKCNMKKMSITYSFKY